MIKKITFLSLTAGIALLGLSICGCTDSTTTSTTSNTTVSATPVAPAADVTKNNTTIVQPPAPDVTVTEKNNESSTTVIQETATVTPTE